MPDSPRYVVGSTYARKQRAKYETKDGYGSGAGYCRWRSTEWRPETARRSKEDVYVPVHRLAAVAWCYPDDMDVSEILRHMDGRDVHHTTGEKWANIGDSPNFDEPGLQVCDHGRHSSITQTQMRAWAEDAKRAAAGQIVAADGHGDADTCFKCGEEHGMLCTTDSLDDNYCLKCIRDVANGEAIEVL